MSMNPFDGPDAARINEARVAFLRSLMPALSGEAAVKTAVDAGCGIGIFSRFLADSGLEVTAFDGRPGNVDEGKRRNPDIHFKVFNVEDPSLPSLGQFDLGLCFGLLYHLENPFQAIRNLSSVVSKALIVESVATPVRDLAAQCMEEPHEANQALDYVALIPSERLFIKMLYRAGFPFVYRTTISPDHEDYRATFLRRRRRVTLMATRVELSHPAVRLVAEPKHTNQWMWYRFGLGTLLESPEMRKLLRAWPRLFRA